MITLKKDLASLVEQEEKAAGQTGFDLILYSGKIHPKDLDLRKGDLLDRAKKLDLIFKIKQIRIPGPHPLIFIRGICKLISNYIYNR